MLEKTEVDEHSKLDNDSGVRQAYTAFHLFLPLAKRREA